MKRTRTGRLKRRNIIWRMRRYLVAGVAVMVLAASGAGAQLWASVKVPVQKPADRVSLVCDATYIKGCDRSNAFAEFGVAETDEDVRPEDVPQVMVYALVAAEDKEFFSHKGVDPTGIARAVVHDFRNDTRQGGSTLTQQLVKVMSEDDSPTLSRKINEAMQAMKLEQETPKKEILTRYFNSVYFGRNARGLIAAARAYFGKDFKLQDMKLKHAAYLAAVIREPEDVDANRRPDDPEREEQRRYATIRRGNVLDTMLAQGYITQAEHDDAAKADWDEYVVTRGEADKGAVMRYSEIGAGQWRDYVRRWILKYTPITAEQLETKGLRVYTTMNPELQRQAEDAVRETLKNAPMPWIGKPEDRPADVPNGPEASLTAIDSQGFVQAVVGSRNLFSSLNIATGTLGGITSGGRQPGSSFKPIVLASALQQGKNLDDKYDNPKSKEIGKDGAQKEVVMSVEGDATPEPITLLDAMAISSNTVFGQLQFDIKNSETIALAKKLGLSDINFQEAANRSSFLGIGGPVHVTTLDMAAVYSVFANNGMKNGPYPVWKITDAVGTPIWPQTPLGGSQVIPPELAQTVSYSLTGVVGPKGTGKSVQVPGQNVVGKTGTVAIEDVNTKKVTGNSDAWFVGYTCKLTAAVWMGHRNDAGDIGTVEWVKPGTNKVEKVNPVNGGTLPAAIFTRFMTEATKLDAYKDSCPIVRPQSSITTTTAPPTTAPPSTRDEPWWMRGRDRDPNDDNTSTTRKPPPWWPTTTDRDDRTTTTRRTLPGQTTTTDPGGPGRPRAVTP